MDRKRLCPITIQHYFIRGNKPSIGFNMNRRSRMAIRELTFQEGEFVSGGVNTEALAAGATTLALGAVAVTVATVSLPATGVALVAAGTMMAVGTIAVAAGGAAMAAGVGDLSGSGSAPSPRSCFTSGTGSPQEACGHIIDSYGDPISENGGAGGSGSTYHYAVDLA